MRQDYQRAIMRAIAIAGEGGKRPARLVTLNAAAAALGVTDRDGLALALDQLLESGLVADQDHRLMLTAAGEGVESELSPDQVNRLRTFVRVAHKVEPDGLTANRKEILFLVAVGEHHGVRIGASTVGEVLNISSIDASAELTSLATEGYLDETVIGQGVSVYSLSKSGRFELRRGDFRIESIRYPQAQTARARELIDIMGEVIGE